MTSPSHLTRPIGYTTPERLPSSAVTPITPIPPTTPVDRGAAGDDLPRLNIPLQDPLHGQRPVTAGANAQRLAPPVFFQTAPHPMQVFSTTPASVSPNANLDQRYFARRRREESMSLQPHVQDLHLRLLEALQNPERPIHWNTHIDEIRDQFDAMSPDHPMYAGLQSELLQHEVKDGSLESVDAFMRDTRNRNLEVRDLLLTAAGTTNVALVQLIDPATFAGFDIVDGNQIVMQAALAREPHIPMVECILTSGLRFDESTLEFCSAFRARQSRATDNAGSSA